MKPYSYVVGVMLGAVMLTAIAAQGQRPMPGTEMVKTSDFGELPREITWQRDGSVMVLIPAGEYTIGVDEPFEKGLKPDEGPAVTVEVGTYYIDKMEISNEQYLKFAQSSGASRPRMIQGRESLLEPNRPVVGVPFYDALQYAEHMAKDLPTEAEWEIAARGRDGLLYPWGNFPNPEASLVGAGGRALSVSIGSQEKDVSPFGVHDLGGNVSEWTKDFYARDHHETAAGRKNPTGPETGESMVVKGGNYYEDGDGRATARLPRIPSQTRDEIGFRTVYRLKPWPTPTPTPEFRETPTPTPAASVRVKALIEKVEESFRNPEVKLPSELTGSLRDQSSVVPVMNCTPHELTLAFVDVERERLYNFPQRLYPGQVRGLNPPPSMELSVFAYAKGAQVDRVVNLGSVFTDSHPFLIIRPETFNTVRTTEGTVLSPLEEDVEALQVYDILKHAMMWNVFEIHNETRLPVETTVSLIPSGKVATQTHQATIASGESLQVTDFGGGKVQISVRYVGAENPSGPDWEFTSSGLHDHRIVVLREDTERGDFVRVLTRRMPLITMSTIETRVDRPRYYFPEVPQGGRRR